MHTAEANGIYTTSQWVKKGVGRMIVTEVKTQIVTLMTAALGFVAALVWKDAITAWLAPLYEGQESKIGLTIAAVVVTIVVVIITVIIAKVFGEKK